MTTDAYSEALGYYVRGRDENYPLDPDILGEEGAVYRADFDAFLDQVRAEAVEEYKSSLQRPLPLEGTIETEQERNRREAKEAAEALGSTLSDIADAFKKGLGRIR